MSDDIFSPEALRKTIQNTPSETASIGVTAEQGEIGIAGSANKTLGKGWSLTAAGSWAKTKGYAVGAWLGWTGKT